MNSPVGHLADSVEMSAIADNITTVAEWTEEWAKSRDLAELAFAMRLCVEEAVTNIVLYAYDTDSVAPTVAVTALRIGGGAEIVISDHGRPFDVAAAPDRGPDRDIQSASVGGRGIRVMRSFSQAIGYARIGQQNRLTLSFLGDRIEPGR